MDAGFMLCGFLELDTLVQIWLRFSPACERLQKSVFLSTSFFLKIIIHYHYLLMFSLTILWMFLISNAIPEIHQSSGIKVLMLIHLPSPVFSTFSNRTTMATSHESFTAATVFPPTWISQPSPVHFQVMACSTSVAQKQVAQNMGVEIAPFLSPTMTKPILPLPLRQVVEGTWAWLNRGSI